MAVNVVYLRRVEKRTKVAGRIPTVPPSSDHTDGSWADTDIYEGEIYINLTDRKLFTREGNNIIELNASEIDSFLGSAVVSQKITITHTFGRNILGIFLVDDDGKNVSDENFSFENLSITQVELTLNFPIDSGDTIEYVLI